MWKITNWNVYRMAWSFQRRIWSEIERTPRELKRGMNLARNWNTILRWVHLTFGMMISVYFARITFTGNTDAWDNDPWVTMFVGQAVVAIVFWTGIIKWQLPRIKKWNRNRKKSKAATNWFGWVARGYPKPLCILFSDTKGIQWVDTDATQQNVMTQWSGYHERRVCGLSNGLNTPKNGLIW